MNDIALNASHTPMRVSDSDSPAEILRFAYDAGRNGGAALATLTEIRGGAARTLGAHVAIAADGRYCGYVSGGCVEAAVAAEAVEAIAEGRDRIVKFGAGSPYFDISLPCGGGITVSIHVLRSYEVLHAVLADLSRRHPAALAYSPQSRTLVKSGFTSDRSHWRGDTFVSVYLPQTRLVISGQTGEVDAVRRLAEASGYEVGHAEPSMTHVEHVAPSMDRYTGVVLLHHDLDLEASLLDRALASQAFYIGALGSTRTHNRRLQRLQSMGVDPETMGRIKAPIGMFGPTRNASTLAISVIADIAAVWLQKYG
ncbi:xdhC and CoxI family protein [Brucella lupini]|uniref:XdhC and CoxI family protein n=2 Tax=Brucella lupini TaxID=255457 RepID=A0A256GZL1_9HYPH|nr:xdhC and CoxI family protein [Brucella lupini]